mgnify:CR=1 FL=1
MKHVSTYSHNQTVTVGLGITPSLLVLLVTESKEAPAGYVYFKFKLYDYRRWGITPRPENLDKGIEKRNYRENSSMSIRLTLKL